MRRMYIDASAVSRGISMPANMAQQQQQQRLEPPFHPLLPSSHPLPSPPLPSPKPNGGESDRIRRGYVDEKRRVGRGWNERWSSGRGLFAVAVDGVSRRYRGGGSYVRLYIQSGGGAGCVP